MEPFELWPRRPSTAGALLALVALQAVVLFTATQRSYFIADDYYHFNLAQERSFLRYLATPIIHTYPAPGHRLLFFALHELFPMNYVAARLILLGLLGATTVFLGQLVRGLARSDQWWTVPLLAPFALSLAFVSVVDWWSAGVPVIPALFFTAVALSAWWRSYTAPTGGTWFAVAVMAIAAAAGFYLKFLLIPVYFLFMRLLVLPSLLNLPAGVRQLWNERRRWLALAAVPALFLAVYVLSGLAGRSYVQGDRPYVPYLTTAWFHVFIPVSLLNIPVTPSTPAPTSWAIVACSQLAFAAIVWSTWRRTSLALKGWALVFCVFMANMLMVGSVRLPTYGAAIAYPLRYYPEILLFVPIAFALGLRQGTERRPEVAWEKSRFGRGAIAMLGCLYATSFGLQAPAIAAASDGARARDWVDNLRHDVAALAADHAVVRLLNSLAPEYVIPAWLSPHNRVSTILNLLQVRPAYDDASGPLYLVRQDGHLSRATFRPIASLWPGEHVDISSGSRVTDATLPANYGEIHLLSADTDIAEGRLALRLFLTGIRVPLVIDVDDSAGGHRQISLQPIDSGVLIVDLGSPGVRALKLRGAAVDLARVARVEIGSVS